MRHEGDGKKQINVYIPAKERDAIFRYAKEEKLPSATAAIREWARGLLRDQQAADQKRGQQSSP